jgi:hypothetical protein
VTSSTPASSTDASYQNAYFDSVGRQVVLLDQLIAGEDLPNNVQAIMVEPISGSAHGLSRTTTTTSGENIKQIKASAGRLYEISCYNDGAIAFLQLFDTGSVTVPIGAIPTYTPAAIAASGSIFLQPGAEKGLVFTNGLVVGLSSTPRTFTTASSTSPLGFFTALWK